MPLRDLEGPLTAVAQGFTRPKTVFSQSGPDRISNYRLQTQEGQRLIKSQD